MALFANVLKGYNPHKETIQREKLEQCYCEERDVPTNRKKSVSHGNP